MRGWVFVLLAGTLVLASCAGDDSADLETLNRNAIADALDEVVEGTSSDELNDYYLEEVRGSLDRGDLDEVASVEALAVVKAMADAEVLTEGQQFCDEAAQFIGDPDGLGQWINEMLFEPESYGMTDTDAEAFWVMGATAMRSLCPKMMQTMVALHDPDAQGAARFSDEYKAALVDELVSAFESGDAVWTLTGDGVFAETEIGCIVDEAVAVWDAESIQKLRDPPLPSDLLDDWGAFVDRCEGH